MSYQDGPIFIRRSVRAYETRPVEREKLERIVRAGMQAPTAMDGRGWTFYVLTSAENKQTVSGMSPYAGMCAGAGAVIVVCGDMEKIRENREEAWWVQGMSACTQNMLLQIVEEGLGGVWLGVYPREQRVEYLREKLNIPGTETPFAVISLGYGTEPNRFEDRYDPSLIHWD